MKGFGGGLAAQPVREPGEPLDLVESVDCGAAANDGVLLDPPGTGCSLGVETLAEQFGQGQVGHSGVRLAPARLGDGPGWVVYQSAGGDHQRRRGIVRVDALNLPGQDRSRRADEAGRAGRRGGEQEHGRAVRVRPSQARSSA